MAKTSFSSDLKELKALLKQKGETIYIVQLALDVVLLAVSFEEWFDLIVRGGGPA